MIRNQARFILIGAIVALIALGVLAIPTSGDAQSQPSGVEVRLAGRLHEDGRIEVALQYWWNGRWSRGLFPTRRYLPTDADDDRWLISAPVQARIRQSQVRLGVEHPHWDGADGPGDFEVRVDGQRYRSNCGYLALRLDDGRLHLGTNNEDCVSETELAEDRLGTPLGQGGQDVRIAARRGSDGTELAVQYRERGGWSERLRPYDALLPRTMTVGRWYYTFSVVLPAPPSAVSGTFHRDASLTVVDGDFLLEVGDRQHRGDCGVLTLQSHGDAILANTLDSHCVSSTALATICGPSVRSGACDVQRNHAYQWERVRLRRDGGSEIQLEIQEAQSVVDAIWDDYFTVRPNPPRVLRSHDGGTRYNSSTHRIHLADWAMTLDVVLHETAHALMQRASVADPGHGERYIALLLALWERYLPIVDVDAARAVAQAEGLEVADSVLPLPRRAQGVRSLRDLLCVYPVKSDRLCRAYAGELDVGPQDIIGPRFGGDIDSLWWGVSTSEETGAVRSYIALESREAAGEVSVARLSIECNAEDELEADIWWRGARSLPADVLHRFGDKAWQEISWRTVSGGTWSGDDWSIHRAIDSPTLLREMIWYAASDLPFFIRYEQNGRQFAASFDLTGVFQTPIQANLVQCSASKQLDSEAPVIDHGRFGDDFFWGVDEDEDPLKTYIVRDTIISGSASEARLRVQCEDGGLDVDVYWAVDQNLDWTVRYRVGNRAVQTEEWISGRGTWGDTEYKWTGREQADDLISQMAWAAQAGGRFTIEAHERNSPNHRYTATFDLDGLFDTPVQPNIPRCGR